MDSRIRPYRERNPKRQARLAFQPVPPSTTATNAYSTAVKDRLASVRIEEHSRPRRKTRSQTSDLSPRLPTPQRSSQIKHEFPFEKRIATDGGSQELDDDDIVLPSSKRRKGRGGTPVDTPTRVSRRLQSNPKSSSSAGHHLPSPKSSQSRIEDIGSPETSGDEERAIITLPTNKHRKPSWGARDDDPFIVPDETSRVAKRATGKYDDFIVDDDDIEYISSEQESVQPRKPRRLKGRRRSRRQQDELDEDLQDLQTSEVEEEPRNRTRGGIVNTQRDRNREHFETLKRRRAGERIPRTVISADDDSDHFGFDQNDGVDMDDITTAPKIWTIAEDDDSMSSEEENPQQCQVLDGGPFEDEDDFIVDDDDENQEQSTSHRSRPAASGIPLQFTSFASSKPKELFVYVVEWLVKNKIAPAFSRNDELYTLAWNKVNDQNKAQADSRLISSAWNADFKNAILARPGMEVVYITDGDDASYLDCDACNKSNHPARYEFTFSGHAYHPNTLEPLDEEKDSGPENDSQVDDASSNSASYDAAGHLLPSSATTFLLGRFCAANAEMGHKLSHWKYHLNQALLAYLEEQGVLSAEAIVAREKRSKKKREKEAEDIVDMMEETGMIAQMWRDLQSDLEDARFGMEDHVSRKGRSRNRIGKVRVSRGNGRMEEWSEGGRVKMITISESGEE